MGGGVSKRNIYICPNNYDTEKFNIILNLYYKLDKNNNSILEIDEIKELSNLHVRDRISLLERERESEKNNALVEIKSIKTKQLNKILEIKSTDDKKIRDITNRTNYKLSSIDKKLKTYSEMNDEEKCNKLIENISYDKKSVDFWKFFLHIKDKTSDVESLI